MRKQTQLKNIIKDYRLTLSEEDSHKIIRVQRFNRVRLTAVVISAVILAFVLIFCIIAFTPIRTTIPGYPDARSRKMAVDAALKVDSLESIITRWELYAENLNRVLSGEQTISIDSIINGNAVSYLSEKSRVELERQDSILRSEVDQEEKATSGEQVQVQSLDGTHLFTPYNGVIIKKFNIADHLGINISASDNSAVCAALDGTIISAGWNEESGYTISIQHKGDIISIYSRCEKMLKNIGDKVSAGAPIALVASGDYLHFELWYKGAAEDPAKYLNIQ